MDPNSLMNPYNPASPIGIQNPNNPIYQTPQSVTSVAPQPHSDAPWTTGDIVSAVVILTIVGVVILGGLWAGIDGIIHRN